MTDRIVETLLTAAGLAVGIVIAEILIGNKEPNEIRQRVGELL